MADLTLADIPLIPCRSEHAREKPESTTGCQASRVIVNHHREHARSYRPGGVPFFQVTCRKNGTLGSRYCSNGYVRLLKRAALRSKSGLCVHAATADQKSYFTPSMPS